MSIIKNVYFLLKNRKIFIVNLLISFSGFSVGRDRSQEDAYKDLQSAGVG